MEYHGELKNLMHLYIKNIYRVTKNFSRDELYGITSQLRRAAVSVILNYIEGYARRKNDSCRVYKNFLEISYGSLKESEYLIYFSFTEGYMAKNEYRGLAEKDNKIGGMIWGVIQKIK